MHRVDLRTLAGRGLCFLAVLAVPLGAQTPAASGRALSLEDALRIAESASEEVGIARASVQRARGEQMRARSERLPQLYGSVGYTRTLASQFESLAENIPPRDPQTIDPPQPSRSQGYPSGCYQYLKAAGTTLEERLAGLDSAARCGGGGDIAALFRDLPFGQENEYTVGLSASQTLYSGGRVSAQTRIAGATRRIAETQLASARAQLVLDVTEAYFNAALSDRLFAIAEATLQQSETTLRQTQLARQVGNQPEFDLLRASVARDNQRPVVIQRRADREIAYTRLKQLLNLPLDEDIALTTALDDSGVVAVARFTSSRLDAAALTDTSTSARAPVRQAAEGVRAREGALRIAQSQRLPAVSVTSQYGRVAYPRNGLPEWSQFLTNWTVGVGLQLPLFTGGRIRGDVLVARANLDEARMRESQMRELAQLDTRTALARLAAAEASWRASTGTAEQASRAYRIAEIRYREGISTQTELGDARILLEQAHANRAVAARDLAIARARVALLRDLPITAPGISTGGGAAGQQGVGPGQVEQQQQPTPRRASPQTQQAGGMTNASQTGAFAP